MKKIAFFPLNMRLLNVRHSDEGERKKNKKKKKKGRTTGISKTRQGATKQFDYKVWWFYRSYILQK